MCRFDPFTAAAANSRTTVEKKRHIAAQFRRHRCQLGQRQAQFPPAVCRYQSRGRIAGTTAQTRSGGNPLDQPQPRTAPRSRPPTNQLRRSQDEIPAIARHFLKAAAVTRDSVPRVARVPGRRTPLALQFQCFARCFSKAQGIVPPDRAHERFNLMVTVAALAQHFEKQVELGRRLDHDLHRIPVDLHVTRTPCSCSPSILEAGIRVKKPERNSKPHETRRILIHAKFFVNPSLGGFRKKLE